MSLINEALKRARDASFPAGQPRPPAAKGNYRATTTTVQDQVALGNRTAVWVSLLVVAIAVTAMLVFSLRLIRPIERIRQAFNVNSEISAPAPKPIEAAPPVVAQKREPVTVPVVTLPLEKKAEPPPVLLEPPAAPPAPVTPVVAPAVAESPKFVLQGITSGPGWREAMINGSTLREGDDLDGARIISIEPRRVKLQVGDHEIILRMP